MKLKNILLISFFTMLTYADPPTTWTEFPRPANTAALNSVEFGNGIFVAVGNSGTIITSSDGMTWEKQNSGISADIWHVKFVNGKFFTMNSADNTLVSADGVNWESIHPFYDLTFANNYYYGIHWTNVSGIRHELARSTDLVNWEHLPGIPGAASRIEYLNGTFFTSDPDRIYRSTDASNWTLAFTGTPTGALKLNVQNNILFVSAPLPFLVSIDPQNPQIKVTMDIGCVSYSTDGEQFALSLREEDYDDPNLSRVVAGGNQYAAVNSDTAWYTSTAGGAWQRVSLPVIAAENRKVDLSFGNAHFVAVVSGKILRSNPVTGAFAPEIFRQPQPFAATVGGTATFSVGVQGSEPMTYQWRKNEVAIVGETGNSLNIAAVSFESEGNYDVVITNNAGSITSQSAALKINFAEVKSYAGVTLRGAVGDKFLVEYQNSLNPNQEWFFAANVTLSAAEYIWIDYASPDEGKRFYRATYQGR